MTTVRTNHQWRQFVYRSEVPAAVLASQFDYQDADDDVDGFFEYRGHWYHLDQFMRLGSKQGPLAAWDAYAGDSYFSGVVIRVSPDGETYQIGTYTC